MVPRPCPEERGRLEEKVTRIENNRGYRYEVQEPRRLAGCLAAPPAPLMPALSPAAALPSGRLSALRCAGETSAGPR